MSYPKLLLSFPQQGEKERTNHSIVVIFKKKQKAMQTIKKGGRPKVEKSKKRDKLIQIRLSSDEKLHFIELQKKGFYKSTSQMIRDIVIHQKFKVITLDPELKEEKSLLISQAKYIGNNFNQYLKMIKSKKLTYFTTTDKNDMLIHIKEIHKLLHLIFKAL